MSDNDDSKLLWMVFIQPSPNRSDFQKDAMDYAAEEFGSNNVVNNTFEMVGRAISLCINNKKQIGQLTIIGHGSPGAFHIGKDRVTINSLTPTHEFYKPEVHLPIMQLTPYFHPRAKIEFQQCNCYGDDGKNLLLKFSQLWKRPVIGFSGTITFGRGVEYSDGGAQFIVCLNKLCIVP